MRPILRPLLPLLALAALAAPALGQVRSDGPLPPGVRLVRDPVTGNLVPPKPRSHGAGNATGVVGFYGPPNDTLPSVIGDSAPLAPGSSALSENDVITGPGLR